MRNAFNHLASQQLDYNTQTIYAIIYVNTASMFPKARNFQTSVPVTDYLTITQHEETVYVYVLGEKSLQCPS